MESSAVAAEFSFYFGSRGIQGQEAGGFDGFGSCDDMAWVVENGNVLGLGDDFVVDDLLDFGQLETTQTEAEGEDDDDNTNTNTNNKEEEEEEEHQNRNKKHHEIQQQQQQQGKEESLGEDNSAVSFEPIPMPVSELTLPAHDAAELEWVSRIMDDSLSEFQTYSAPKPYFPPQHMHMPMTMPMPMPMPMLTIPVKAKRSKRARSMSWSSSCSSSSSWGSGVPLLFIDSSSSTTTSSASSSSCSSSSYSSSSSFKQQQQQQQFILGHQVCDEIPVSVYPHHPPHNYNYNYGSKILNCVTLKKQKAKKKGKGKKRGRKPKKSVVVVVVVGEGGGVERQCRHCGVNKTPQWRTGPEGAKTLCNACGVRYKSGRLLPEYRPACSPSFLNHVHSNSHRKVIEMRRNKGEYEHQELSSTIPLPSFSSSTPPLSSAAWVN